jgi:SAM-dependent methyltransferase
MIVLNLGCGTKTSESCINIDWSIYLRIKNNIFLKSAAAPFISAERRNRLNNLSSKVLVHDMRRGLPFEACSVDAVYHSHVLEHIDRKHVPTFQKEIHRVLKPDGIQRICVPDLELLARRYLDSITRCEADPTHVPQHDQSVSDILEQSVRKEAYGTSTQPPLRRHLENLLLGDARQRGETHQWMYDRFNLSAVLKEASFTDIRVGSWNESAIEGWKAMALEVDETGGEYKPDSLYVECRR